MAMREPVTVAGGGSKPSSSKRVPSERIYSEVRDRICLLAYPPGTVLREGELALEFGVSRTPIREVLHRLSFDGLVAAKNGVGSIVTSLDYISEELAKRVGIEWVAELGHCASILT